MSQYFVRGQSGATLGAECMPCTTARTVPFSEMYKSIVKRVIKDVILLVIREG